MFTVFKIFSCFLVAIALTVSACGLLEHPEQRVVITVGTRNITVKELKRDLRRVALETEVTAEGEEQPRDNILQRVINYYLILEYGREQGISISEGELGKAVQEIKKDYSEKDFQETLVQGYIDFKEWKEGLRQTLLIRKIAESTLQAIGPVSFQEIKVYYESHQDEFRHPAMVRFRQILTNTKGEAEAMLKRIANGEGMGELVEKYGPQGIASGDDGTWIAKGDLDESMEKALFSLSPGKISGIVETPYGFHILQVLEKKPEGFRTLAEAMKEIEAKVLLEKEEVFYRNWLKELRESIPVHINHELLKSVEMK